MKNICCIFMVDQQTFSNQIIGFCMFLCIICYIFVIFVVYSTTRDLGVHWEYTSIFGTFSHVIWNLYPIRTDFFRDFSRPSAWWNSYASDTSWDISYMFYGHGFLLHSFMGVILTSRVVIGCSLRGSCAVRSSSFCTTRARTSCSSSWSSRHHWETVPHTPGLTWPVRASYPHCPTL